MSCGSLRLDGLDFAPPDVRRVAPPRSVNPQSKHLRGSLRSSLAARAALAAGVRQEMPRPARRPGSKEDERMKPAAMAIPKDDSSLPKGKYGPVYPRTPACYGFTIIAHVKPGRAEAIRSHGPKI